MGFAPGGGGGALGYFFVWVCAALDSNLAPRSTKISPKIDSPVLEFALKMIPRYRNGLIFYTPF